MSSIPVKKCGTKQTIIPKLILLCYLRPIYALNVINNIPLFSFPCDLFTHVPINSLLIHFMPFTDTKG